MHNITSLVKSRHQVVFLYIQGPSFFQAWLNDLLRLHFICTMNNNHSVLRNRGKIIQGLKVNNICDILWMLFYLFDNWSAVNIPYNDTEIITSRDQGLSFCLREGYAVYSSSVAIQSKQWILLTNLPKFYCVVQTAWSKASLHKRIVFDIHDKMCMFLEGLSLLVNIVLLFPEENVLVITASQYFLCGRIINCFSKEVLVSFELTNFSLWLIVIYLDL